MDTEGFNQQQQQINAKIEQAEQKRNKLSQALAALDSKIDQASGNVDVYGVLSEISEKLELLHSLGQAKLFWGDKYTNENELLEHVSGLRSKTKVFEEQTDAVTQQRETLAKQLSDAGYEMAYLEDELQVLKELEEDSKSDFVTRREIEPIPYRAMVMPWHHKDEDEKRYKQYVLLALLYSTLFGLLIPLWQLPIPDRSEEIKVPERFAQLLKKEEPKPEPKVEKLKKAEDKPTKKAVKKARKKAAKSGLLAFKNNFADLMDDATEAKLGANAKLSKQGSRAKSTARSLVSAQAQSGSGGIETASLSRDVGTAGGQIGAVAFSRVDSAIGTSGADDRPLTDGPGPSRTDEEIQIVFDRYKAALYRIYNKELRKNPTLKGKIVLRITILPNGTVSNCKVESSDLKSAALSAGITARVKRFNFGNKPDVSKVTILYPIDFLPAS